MLPVAPVATLIVVRFVATLRLSAEPEATDRSVPAPPEIVSAVGFVAPCRLTVVLPDTDNCPIVCVGTAVTVMAAPLLNISTSFAAGVVRAGVQFAAVAPP